MKKTVISTFLLLSVLFSSLTLIPSAQSATSDIKVLDFSHYLDADGILWVVGEVQNQGQQIIRYVLLTATATQGDGTATDPSSGQVWAKYLLPEQKAPFAFPIDNTNTASGAWTGIPIKSIDITITQADATRLYQYSDVKVTENSYSIDENGTYWVSGTLQNMGSQTAEGITVVTSFYNSSGIIIAATEREADSLTLEPGATTAFLLSATDLNTLTASSNRQIQTYSSAIFVSAPLLTAEDSIPTPEAPTINSGPAPSPVASSNAPTGDDISSNQWIIIAAIVVVVAFVGVLLVMRMRKPKTTKATASKQVLSKKQQKKADKNAKR